MAIASRRICLVGIFLLLLWAVAHSTAWAQAPGRSGEAKQIPPPGIEVPGADRAELQKQLSALEASLKELSASKEARVKSLLPDVQIFHRAVSTALANNEFFAPEEIGKAKELLKEGQARANQLLGGEAPWQRATGLVVRGYVSRLDGSVQPYALVVPESYRPGGNYKFRLDIWLNGRNEKLSEVNFLDTHLKKAGEFTPPDTIVLHPYGRFCNAYKFAGEVDVFEALAAVKKNYRVDEDRTAMRGFSMGGAGCWHLAVHHADQWVAATPGAGFAETAEFIKMSADDVAKLPEWQRKLFLWYDCPPWAANLYHCPTIAYNGADDPQKQAADVMEKALQEEGIALRRVIGPGTKHAFHPDSKRTIEQSLASIVDAGRDRMPLDVHFVTYTLRYNRLAWVQVDGLEEHWSEARVEASVVSNGELSIDTKNVSDLTLSFPPGWSPFDVLSDIVLTVDGEEVANPPRSFSDRSWECKLHRDAMGQWQIGAREEKGLHKRPGLQGPIDDAFLEKFIVVRPTGKGASEATAKWVQAEMDRALREWRREFRGEAQVKNDADLTDEDIASANLILWGDATSNAVIKKIADKLPIRWQGDSVVVDREKFPAATHVPAFVFPNPLNPERYVVLNSGVTFREADYISNARQVPRLPDWAVIDTRTPADARRPGEISAAGFFGEHWELNPTAKADVRRTAATFGNRLEK